MVVASTCSCGTVRSQMAAPSGCKPRTTSLLKVNPAATAKSLQSCLTLCNPIHGSPPRSSIHGIFQARTLGWGESKPYWPSKANCLGACLPVTRHPFWGARYGTQTSCSLGRTSAIVTILPCVGDPLWGMGPPLLKYVVSGIQHSDSVFLPIVLLYKFLHNNRYSSLCYTVNPSCLSILPIHIGPTLCLPASSPLWYL